MRREGLGFGEALRLLAQRAGVALAPKEEGRERLFAANEAAAAFYHRLLAADAGRAARHYLAGRGVDEVATGDFRLGYSPQSWDSLRNHLEAEGFARAELLGVGLLVENEGRVYDRFRGRLIFPIANGEGRVVGFGARALESEGSPKYINTPQTSLFDKGRLLYGLHRAHEEIRRQGLAVIVEGYMDVIAAHQHGFANVVACMGTSLTEGQVALLQRHTRRLGHPTSFPGRTWGPRLALALDPDQAGSEATLRGIQVVAAATEKQTVPLPTGRGGIRYQQVSALEVRVIVLPPGQDPDDLIRSSPQRWRELVEGAQPVMEHLFALASAGADPTQPQERSRMVASLLPAVAAVEDPVLGAHYLQRLARLAQVSERSLEDELRAYRRRLSSPRARTPAAAAPAEAPGESPKATGGLGVKGEDPLEEFLLALLLRYPELRERGLALDEGLLWRAENRQLLEAWRRGPVDALEGALSPEILPCLERIRNRELPPYVGAEAARALESCLGGLERRRLALAKRAATYALAEEEERLGPGPAAALARALWQAQGPEGEAQEPLSPEAARAASLYLQDMEASRRLHRQGRPPEPEAPAG